jgi:hypothetical protein
MPQPRRPAAPSLADARAADRVRLYGEVPRAVFEAHYRPVTPAQVRQAQRRAIRLECFCEAHDVLVEDAGEGLVRLLPVDAMPYVWRTFWRLQQPQTMTQEDPAHAETA